MVSFIVEEACNRVVFETWLQTCLIPVLKAGQVVIVDNATLHHGGRIVELIEAAGCRLLYLPPYLLTLTELKSVELGSKVEFANAYLTPVICGRQ